MPWIKQQERLDLEKNFKTCKKVTKGQATYLFYKRFLGLWNKENKYHTIHFVGLLRERPELDSETWELTKQLLFKEMTKSEITQSRYDAHHQMERIYFDTYAQKKLEENGEVNV